MPFHTDGRGFVRGSSHGMGGGKPTRVNHRARERRRARFPPAFCAPRSGRWGLWAEIDAAFDRLETFVQLGSLGEQGIDDPLTFLERRVAREDDVPDCLHW